WSSDVCSSDLHLFVRLQRKPNGSGLLPAPRHPGAVEIDPPGPLAGSSDHDDTRIRHRLPFGPPARPCAGPTAGDQLEQTRARIAFHAHVAGGGEPDAPERFSHLRGVVRRPARVGRRIRPVWRLVSLSAPFGGGTGTTGRRYHLLGLSFTGYHAV